LTYDKKGERYEIPIFCINDPLQYDVPKKLMHKKENVPDDQITIKLRFMGKDTKVTLPQNSSTLELKE